MEKTDTVILPELSMFLSTMQSQSGGGRTALLPCLHTAQELYGYIPETVVQEIANNLEITSDEIYDVIDYFPLFHRKPVSKTIIHICNDHRCNLAGYETVFKSLQYHMDEDEFIGEEVIQETPCLGLCVHTPSLLIQGGLMRIPVKNIRANYKEKDGKHSRTTILGKNRQITRNCGKGRTCTLMEYWSKNGYQALKSILGKPCDSVIAEIKSSGLTGRGGESLLTGIKWEKAAAASNKPKFIICNASESDPTSFKDRILLEDDPHSILEGMIIAGYALQANQGYLCINGNYDLAYHILSDAIIDAREAGLLGKNIMGSNFNFEIEIRKCAGRYVSGEETALLEMIEGKCAIPRNKPPFSTSQGLFGKPTVVNNVETFANVPIIIQSGALKYRKIGTETSKGTMLISLTGDVQNPGLAEIPFGTTFRELIFKMAGGTTDNVPFLAALVGGVTGTFISETELDNPISLEYFKKAGISRGLGSIIVFDNNRNLADILFKISRFVADESCGKCSSCVIGTRVQQDVMKKSRSGKLKPEDLKAFKDARQLMDRKGLCRLAKEAMIPGQSAFMKWPSLFFE